MSVLTVHLAPVLQSQEWKFGSRKARRNRSFSELSVHGSCFPSRCTGKETLKAYRRNILWTLHVLISGMKCSGTTKPRDITSGNLVPFGSFWNLPHECYVVFNSHMIDATEVQLRKWYWHTKFNFNLGQYMCAHFPSVIIAIMDQKQLLLEPLNKRELYTT
jgi:hypothetical protein